MNIKRSIVTFGSLSSISEQKNPVKTRLQYKYTKLLTYNGLLYIETKMKFMRFLVIIVTSLCLLACGSDDRIDPNCNFLLNNLNVDSTVNLGLPQFSQLQFVGNSVFIPGLGNQGVIISNTGGGFFAWDASDPNHELQACSTLSISGGLSAVCGCEDETAYSLVTGQALGSSLPCSLINYPVQQQGNTLFIRN